VESGTIILLEGLLVFGIVLAIGLHQLWTLRKPPKPKDDAAKREGDGGAPGAG
jgi:hypothetical protein